APPSTTPAVLVVALASLPLRLHVDSAPAGGVRLTELELARASRRPRSRTPRRRSSRGTCSVSHCRRRHSPAGRTGPGSPSPQSRSEVPPYRVLPTDQRGGTRLSGRKAAKVDRHETVPLSRQCQTCGTRVEAASALGLRDAEIQHLRGSERCRVQARRFT